LQISWLNCRSKYGGPQRQTGCLFMGCNIRADLGGFFVETRPVLNLSERAVGAGGVGADGRWDQAAVLGALEQSDVAHVIQ
jgi:hypothetical protein